MADTATVAVEATEERFRALKHFPSGLGFSEEGTARWPADQFTFRLRDEGAIRLTEDLHDAGEPAETKQAETAPAPAGKPTAAAKAAPSPKE